MLTSNLISPYQAPTCKGGQSHQEFLILISLWSLACYAIQNVSLNHKVCIYFDFLMDNQNLVKTIPPTQFIISLLFDIKKGIIIQHYGYLNFMTCLLETVISFQLTDSNEILILIA